MKKKKVLGISFGRKMGTCEIMVKHALMECERQGCEVRYIRADELNVGNCTGCISCVIGMTCGHGRGYCYMQDDFDLLDEAIMESDGVILGCPTYETSVTGRFKTICDRIGPSHDITFRKAAYDQGLAQGKPAAQLPDPRAFLPRSAALISVGGAMTENWIALTLPMMFEFTFPLGIDVVDTVEYWGAMAHESVVGNPKILERMTRVGHNLCASLLAEVEDERIAWRGEEEGICPVCHCRLLQVSRDKRTVDCVVCGSQGTLDMGADGTIQVQFTEEEQLRSRLKWGGKLEHSTEIKEQAQPAGSIPNLKELKACYVGYGEQK